MKNMNDYKHFPREKSKSYFTENTRIKGLYKGITCGCGNSFFYKKRSGATKAERTNCPDCLSKLKLKLKNICD